MIKKIALFFLVLGLSSCNSKGELANNSENGNLLNFKERVVLDYNQDSVFINFIGNLNEDLIEDGDQILFFSNSTCSNEINKISASKFIENKSIEFELSRAKNEHEIYISRLSDSTCEFLETYALPPLVPSAPVFDQIVPATPNRISTTPGIFGSSFPKTSTIKIYEDSNCENLLVEDSQNSFLQSGIGLSLQANTITSLYAQTVDTLLQTSTCTFLIDYEHSDALSSPPIFSSFNPSSPSNLVLNPKVIGTVSGTADSINIFSDSGCTDLLSTGTAVDFTSTGIEFNAIENGTLEVFAQSTDDQGVPSACTRISEYTHDNISPQDPVFLSITPLSPNNITTTPLIVGSLLGDSVSIDFYNGSTCSNRIGTGFKEAYESTGLIASVASNSVTDIYAKSFDLAGNGSACTEFSSYKHNTIAPNPPTFQGFNPSSPTNITTSPFIGGLISDRTITVSVYSDEQCTNQIGTGSGDDFQNTDIQITVPTNTDSDIYITAVDVEGNVSACTSAAQFQHSTEAANAPQFSQTLPASPSNASINPRFLGLADSTITDVFLYSDNLCSNSLGFGSRNDFLATGIQIAVSPNFETDVYAKSRNNFGNNSACTFLTTYTHVDVVPLNPTFNTISPLSPNNFSFTPTVTGGSLQNPASLLPPNRVAFYTDFNCVVQAGEGSPEDFVSGIDLTLPSNAISQVYARSFDAATNRSDCTFLTSYTHNAYEPAFPIFENSIAASPSYSNEIYLNGRYSSNSQDFMNRTALSVYSDSTCSSLIQSGNPQDFDSSGFYIEVPENQNTSLYGQSTNEVGTLSTCSLLTNFLHSDAKLTNLNLNLRANGSVFVTWFPDNIASPSPTYTLERSVNVNGPYAIVAQNLNSVSFTDVNVSNGVEYYYRVYAANTTGRGNYSDPSSIMVSPSTLPAGGTLTATPRDEEVGLSWVSNLQTTYYKIYRSEQPNGPFNNVYATTLSTSYFDENVVNDETYYYVIRYTNPSGVSTESNVASATPKETPTPVENFKMTLVNNNPRICNGAVSLLASWKAKSYVGSYVLNSANNKGQVQNTVLSTTQNNAIHCNIFNLPNDLSYLNIIPQWPNGTISISNTEGFFETSAPRLEAFAGDDEVLLTWSDVVLDQTLQNYTLIYDLFYSSDPDQTFEPLALGVNQVSYVDTLANGEARYYYIQAYVIDIDGDRIYIGPPSVIQSARPAATPQAPSNLTVENNEGSKVKLDWSSPSHYNGFSIYKSNSALGPFTEIGYTTNNSFSIFSESEGLHYYMVRAVWATTESTDSNVVEQRVAEIKNLTLVPTNTEITLNWDSILGASDYVIYKDTEFEGSFSSSSVVTSNTYTDTGLLPNISYFYKIKARFLDGTEGTLANASSSTSNSTLPTGLRAESQSTGGVRVSWLPVPQALQYRVLTSDQENGVYELARTTVNTSTDIFGLALLTEVFFKVEYVFDTQTFTSEFISFTPKPILSPPIVRSGDNLLNIEWFTTLGANDYDLLRSTDGINFVPLVSGYSNISYVDNSVVNGSLYFYKVQANFDNAITSLSGSSVGITPGIVPLEPSGLQVENTGTGINVELSWSSVDGVNRYAVYQSTTSGVYDAPVLETSSNLRVVLSGLSTNQQYFFTVKSLNGDIESPFSQEVSIVLSPNLEAPDVSYETANSLSLLWPDVVGASTFDVFRSIDSYNFDLIASNVNTNSYIDSSLDVAETNYYKYLARTASGVEIALSNVSQPINLDTAPLTPTDLRVFLKTQTEANLSWSAQTSVFAYQIFRSTTAGTGYVQVGEVPSNEISFTDTTLSPNQSYYYVVRSTSSIGVPSSFSNEVSIATDLGITDLLANDLSGQINLTWSALPGVLNYSVYRSTVTGGPFTFIGTTNNLSYSDITYLPEREYFYIVSGVYSTGEETVVSNEVTLSPSGFLDFEVSIDLIDEPARSKSLVDQDFKRGQVSFDPEDYDGVVEISYEVVAQNFDNEDRSVLLLDQSDIIVDQVTVPAFTSISTRLRKAFINLNSELDHYRIALEGTNSDGDLTVESAKILIRQDDATKTKIYYPLISSESNASSNDYTNPVFSTNSLIPVKDSSFTTYLRETESLTELSDFNSWELEAVVASSGFAEGELLLYNENESISISGSQIVIDDNEMRVGRAFIQEGTTGLSTSNENQKYGLRLLCTRECDTGDVRVYKAGIWIKLQNLSELRLYHKLNKKISNLSQNTFIGKDRYNLGSANYSSPTYKYRVIASDGPLDSGSFELSGVSSPSGDAGAQSVPGSLIMVDFDQNQIYTSTEFTPVPGLDYITNFGIQSGSVDLESSFIMIDVKR